MQGLSGKTRGCGAGTAVLVFKTVLNICWKSFLEYLDILARAKKLEAGSWGAGSCGVGSWRYLSSLSRLLASTKVDLKDMIGLEEIVKAQFL